MARKLTFSEAAAEAARLESAAHELREMADATHKTAYEMRLRATAARKKAQQTTRRAKTQTAKESDQTSAVHRVEKTGHAAHQKARKLT